MIAATTEIQTLLGLPSTNYNARIGALRQIVQDDLIQICNNDFFMRKVYVKGSDLEMTTSSSTATGGKITHGSAEFLNTADGSKFIATRDIVLSGSRMNDGHYELTAVSSGALVLTVGARSLVAESTGNTATVAQVDWPEGLKPYYAQMVWHKIDKAKGNLAASERIDDYSITYETGSHGYPQSIIDGLKSAGYAKVRMS